MITGLMMISAVAAADRKVAYDNDDRMEENEATTQMKQIGQAAMMLASKSDLTRDGEFWTFDPSSHSQSAQFGGAVLGCDHPFPYKEQATLGWCSGALVGDQYASTAGHCLRDVSGSGYSCEQTVFILNADRDQVARGKFPVEDVYECAEVVAGDLKVSGSVTIDFAVVKLDRIVENGATPAVVRKTTTTLGESALLIGHPYGLPKKYNVAMVNHKSDAIDKGYYHWNGPFDAFGGNSGSGVYSMENNELIGILVEGATDFSWGTTSDGNQCVDVNFCHPKEGEDTSVGHGIEYECHPNYPYGEKIVGSAQIWAECDGTPDSSVVRSTSEWTKVCTQMESNAASPSPSPNPTPTPTPSPAPVDDDDATTTETPRGEEEGEEDQSIVDKITNHKYFMYAAAGVALVAVLIVTVISVLVCRRRRRVKRSVQPPPFVGGPSVISTPTAVIVDGPKWDANSRNVHNFDSDAPSPFSV